MLAVRASGRLTTQLSARGSSGCKYVNHVSNLIGLTNKWAVRALSDAQRMRMRLVRKIVCCADIELRMGKPVPTHITASQEVV